MKSSLLTVVLLRVFLFFVPLQVAFAQFEVMPEYETPNETQVRSFAGPEDIVSEYQSDVLTYSRPPSWEFGWLEQKQALQLSAGSLNWFRLRADNRFKFQRSLSEKLNFHLLGFDARDLEHQSQHLVFEFDYGVLPFLKLAFYGEPAFRKGEADLGYAVETAFGDSHALRYFQTYYDAPKNKHNDADDHFRGVTYPSVFGLQGLSRHVAYLDFVGYGFRYEPRLHWRFPQYQATHTVEKSVVNLKAGKMFTGEQFFLLQFQYDDLRNDVESNAVVTKRARSRYLLRAENEARLSGDLTVLVGFDGTQRTWKVGTDSITYRDIIPHGWASYAVTPDTRARIGYDIALHRKIGTWPREVQSVGRDGWRAENRLNLGAEFQLSQDKTKACELIILGTFDLDEKGTKRRFQGGNGQFRVTF